MYRTLFLVGEGGGVGSWILAQGELEEAECVRRRKKWEEERGREGGKEGGWRIGSME